MLSYSDAKGFPVLDSDEDLVVSDTWRPTRSTRATARGGRNSRRRNETEEEYSGEEVDARRSGRTKRQKKSYAEVAEDDDDLVRSDIPRKSTKPRVVHSKEVFPILEDDDEFVVAHCKVCDTCKDEGDSRERGRLVWCHGCSMSYHKECLGNRSTREHLVTKVSDANFVLQCRRCSGVPRKKDRLQAAFDRCTDCQVQGHSCKPFRDPKKKELVIADGVREATPDTHVSADDLYNARNVMFRCTRCFRAWHYDHLPSLGKRSNKGDVWEKRLFEYSQDFKCKTCVELPEKLDTIIAWRPLAEASRETGPDAHVTMDDFNEDEREYLIKFQGQSHFKAQWVPGAWLSGAYPQMRKWFTKKRPDAVMKTEDAIDEEWLRIEICLEVEYTSYVRMGDDVEVDLARINEVSRAYVKFRGLTYEDVVWEEPPGEDDERYDFWKRAYQDYIHGQYVHLPKTVSKKVEKARATDFQKLELKSQPGYISGGTLMEYQKEGMKWVLTASF